MPSSKDPSSIVNSGPGRLPAGSVNASALTFQASAGNSANSNNAARIAALETEATNISGQLGTLGTQLTGLQGHITDPLDAHMAGAVGVPAIDPNTGDPLLISAGGYYEGESVLDALRQLKNIAGAPPPPPTLGYSSAQDPNVLPPVWAGFHTAKAGAWTYENYVGGVSTGPGELRLTKYLIGSNVDTPYNSGKFPIRGTVYPADRGVLAVYVLASGADIWSNPPTLFAALWLGSGAGSFGGIPSANFDQTQRVTGQGTYTPSMTGYDKISLTARKPYLENYPGGEYYGYSQNWYPYQLAKFEALDVPLGSTFGAAHDNHGSYLIVHWKESFADDISKITTLNYSDFSADNCYSATNAPNVDNLVRNQVYRIPNSPPVQVTDLDYVLNDYLWMIMSHMMMYSAVSLNITGTITNLFAGGYFTQTNASGSVPGEFVSDRSLVKIDLTGFGLPSIEGFGLFDVGASEVDLGVLSIRDAATHLPFTTANPPKADSVVEFSYATPLLKGGDYLTPPTSVVRLVTNRPGYDGVVESLNWDIADKNLLFSPQAYMASSPYRETFTDEAFRVSYWQGATSNALVQASPFDTYSSYTLAAQVPGGGLAPPDLLVLPGKLIWPQGDFTGYVPAGRNYDDIGAYPYPNSAPKVFRRDFRVPSNLSTGRLQIKGITLSDIDTGNSAPDSTYPLGGIRIFVGSGNSGLQDLGRLFVPGTTWPKSDGAVGCRIADDGDIFTYSLAPAAIANGEYRISVEIHFLDYARAGQKVITEVRWLPPL